MRDALKPSHHCDEYNSEYFANLGPARCDVGIFLMHAERKAAKSRETLIIHSVATLLLWKSTRLHDKKQIRQKNTRLQKQT